MSFEKYIGIIGFGIAILVASYQYNKKFLDWLRFQSLGRRDYIVEKLNIMFIDIPAHRILASLILLAIVPGVLVFLAFLPQVFPGVVFGFAAGILGWVAPKPIVDWLYNRRVNKFTIQMVDALSLMSNGLKSGLSIVQSLGLVTQEMPNPIQQEFSLILGQNKVGVSLEEAFNSLARRIKSDDVEMFVTSVNILKETGGNLAETFDTIVTTIRERIKVQNKIKALVAQGFNQGMIVLAIPPILGFLFYQSDPDFMRPLFTTALGWVIVMVIILLEVVGFFVIIKVVEVDI